MSKLRGLLLHQGKMVGAQTSGMPLSKAIISPFLGVSGRYASALRNFRKRLVFALPTFPSVVARSKK
jgi:hypothetical protein